MKTKCFPAFRLPLFLLQLPAEEIDDRVRAIFKVHDGDGVMIFNVSKHPPYILLHIHIVISVIDDHH